MIPAELYDERTAPWLTTPIYFGRRELLSRTGDYFVPPWHPGVAVVLAETGPKAFVNVCRHRQSIILEGRGNVSQIRCAMHGWAWDLDGNSRACPGFDEGADLLTYELAETKGWLYAPGSTFADFVANYPMSDFGDYRFFEASSHTYDCTWLDHMDVAADLNHVPFIHPGFRALMDCSDPEIIYGDGWSAHKVPFTDGSGAPGAAGVWWRTLADRLPDATEKFAWWANIYPNVNVDHYGDVLARVSVIVPTDGGCVCHETEWIHRDWADDSELRKSFLDMYADVDREDSDLMAAQQTGRDLLASMGLRDRGPYRDPTELGLRHFHQWLLDRVADTPPSD